MPDRADVFGTNVAAPGRLADTVAQIVTLPTEARQALPATQDITERLQSINAHLPESSTSRDCRGQIKRRSARAIATALSSAFSGRPRRCVAMTGESALWGRVLVISGLKERLLAAHRAGVRAATIPTRSKTDLQDWPREVLHGVELTLAETLDEVLESTLALSSADLQERAKKL